MFGAVAAYRKAACISSGDSTRSRWLLRK